MQLTSIEILNLWGEDKITLEFDQRVTFLTGINGCGKSTFLNIIYDTLNQSDDLTPTSKNRFWSSMAIFDSDKNDKWIAKSIFPSNEKTKTIAENKSYPSIHNIDELKALEQKYRATDSSLNTSYITETIKSDEAWLQYAYGDDSDTNHHFFQTVHENKSAFIFQEDRNHLHNQENVNLDKSTAYWKDYHNSIDERFHYIRDKMQIHEAQANKALVDQITSDNNTTDIEKTKAFKTIQAIKKVTAKLNQYLKQANKEIAQDHNGKLTLKPIDNDEPISWHLLSRGEKTLIYLFFAVYLYQDKVTVFLLDEPEIALHPKWQDNLIKDLSDLAPEKQFIIATHSPSLIKNGWLGNCLNISKR